MKLTKILLMFFLLIAIIAGCSDSSTSPGNSSQQVNGAVTSENGVPLTGVTVQIENQTVITTADGKFTVPNVKAPFNVKLLKTEGGISKGVEYVGLRNFSPVLTMDLVPSDAFLSTIQLNLPFSLGANQNAIVVFTDNANVFSMSNIISGQSAGNLVSIWKGSSSISGKIYVLVYTKFATNITSYDNYGEIDFTINSGSTQTKTITLAEINTNPPELEVSGSIMQPTGFSNVTSQLSLKASGGFLSGIPLSSVSNGVAFSYLVPGGLGNDLQLSLIAVATGSSGKQSTADLVVQPGSTNIQINLVNGSDLNTPANNSSGIDTNNIFTFTPVSGAGTYKALFSSGTRKFTVYSSSTSITIPNFAPFGVEIGNNQNYTWSVSSVNASIDALVSKRMDDNSNVTRLENSDTWFFTTN